jgi:hypothetical protein
MARVAAVRQAEIMKENLDNPARTPMVQGTVPGFVIVIRQPDGTEQAIPPPPAPMIDVTPIEEPGRPYQREP